MRTKSGVAAYELLQKYWQEFLHYAEIKNQSAKELSDPTQGIRVIEREFWIWFIKHKVGPVKESHG